MSLRTPKPEPAPGGADEAAAEDVRARLKGVPRGPLVLPPALDPKTMDRDIQEFAQSYEAEFGPIATDVRAVILRAYPGIGRAYVRYRQIATGQLKPEICDWLKLVRREIDPYEITDPYLRHLTEIERALFEMINGIHEEGLGYVMNPDLGIHTTALAQGLERVLKPMAAGCPDLDRLDAYRQASFKPYDTLADALTRYYSERKPDDPNDDLVVPIQDGLRVIGFDDAWRADQLISLGVAPVIKDLSPGDKLINEQVYAHAEQLMNLVIQKHLARMSSQIPGEWPKAAREIASEILAFIKFTLLNRWRVMRRYAPIVTREGGDQKRPIDNVRMPIKATGELLRIFHLIMHGMRNGAHQKRYLL